MAVENEKLKRLITKWDMNGVIIVPTDVLIAELLPLLEAGAKLRVRLGCIPTFSEDRQAIEEYDAALG